jgi:DNA-directed RNA polymerase specialized sigma24 family protein
MPHEHAGDPRRLREIAAVVGITESNVGVKINRIKAALAAQLAKEAKS